ncbi:MAG: hypothetical protein NC217_04385 [Muribaculaceae bacterium]|nr:hypothetical protein [Muribaculaceae bacterium]
MKTIDEIKSRYEQTLDADEAIAAYTELIDANREASDDPYVERAILYWKKGERALAINDLNEAIRINPKSRAVQAKSAFYEILDFYDKDRYNP